MLNVHSAGYEPYRAAAPLPRLGCAKKLKLLLCAVVDVLKVIIISAPIFLLSIVKLFITPQKKNIQGQNALITGGANGIGKAIAIELAKQGCNIVIADIDKESTINTVKELKEYNIQCVGYKVDVSDASQVESLKEKIDHDVGAIDILVNNAGLMPLLSLRGGESYDIERITNVNINSNFWTIRVFLKGMFERKRGHIVQISSMSALHALPGATIYTATKFAVTGLMRAFEEEVRQEGYGEQIKFTTVHPYFVSTRKDLMDALNLRFPPITAKLTAEKTVEGILQESRVVVIPGMSAIFLALFKSLPYEVQCLLRDYVLQERKSMVIKDPENHIISKKYN